MWEEEMNIYGLRNSTTKSQVPLPEMSVEVKVQGFIANVEYNLSYFNDEEEPIEASFVFPLHDNSAIYRFEAKLGSRLVIGEVQEKEQARETYDDAIASGRSAFLMEESQTSGDIFELLVGNLPPYQDAVVTFAYVIELELEVDGGICFQLPSVIKPRYQHDTGKDQRHLHGSTAPFAGTAAKRSKNIAPEVYSEGNTDFRFSFKMEVIGHRTIRAVKSAFPSDKIGYVFQNDEQTHVQAMLMNEFQFDHDLKIILLYTEPFQPHVVMETGNPSASGFLTQHLAMLNFYPDLSTFGKDEGQGEYIFILDRSGSMSGSHIIHARTALMKFLKVLPPDSYFNVVSFGSNYAFLADWESLENTPKNNKMALSSVSKMMADMGGTEIGETLRAVYDLPTITGYPRTLFLLTDGSVSDTADVINLVKKNSKQARVFTFGIGHGASTALVTGIARAGRGRHEMITDLHRLTRKVQQMLLSSMPCARDVTLDLEPPVDCSIIPTELPPIYIGQRMLVFAAFDPEKMKDSIFTVSLKGRIGDRQFEYSLPLSFDVATTDVAPVHRLAAKRWIKELTDEENHGNHKDRIILVSCSANVVSKYTSFVGVDKLQTVSAGSRPVCRTIPTPKAQVDKQRRIATELEEMRVFANEHDVYDDCDDATDYADYDDLTDYEDYEADDLCPRKSPSCEYDCDVDLDNDVILKTQGTTLERELTSLDMAKNDGPTIKGIRLYISDEEGLKGIKRIDFGASLNTVIGKGKGDGSKRHFVCDVTSGGPAEQFGMKSGDEILMLNYFPLMGKSDTEVADMFCEEKVGVGFSLVFQRPMDSAGIQKSVQCCQASGIVLPVAGKVSHLQFYQQVVPFNQCFTLQPETVYVYHPEGQRYFHVSSSGHRLSARRKSDFKISNEFSFQMVAQFNPCTGRVRIFFRHTDSSGNTHSAHLDGNHVTMMNTPNLLENLPRTVGPEYAVLVHGVSNGQRLYALEAEQSPGYYVTLETDQVVVQPSTVTPEDDANLHFQIFTFMTKSGEPSVPGPSLPSSHPRTLNGPYEPSESS